MDAYLTDDEQFERMRKWVLANKLPLLAIIALVIASALGYHVWQARRTKMLIHASSLYERLLTAVANNHEALIARDGERLSRHYGHTIYADLAALMLARQAVYRKQYPQAEKELNWVIDHSAQPALRQLARIRLARIMLEAGQAEQALNVLAKTDDPNYQTLIEEVKGDIYTHLQQITNARNSYQLAVQTMPDADTSRPLLLLKLQHLPVSGD